MIFSRAGATGDISEKRSVADTFPAADGDPDDSSTDDYESMTMRYLIDELRRLCAERQTGALELTAPDGGRIVVLLFDGMIEAVSSNMGDRRLGEYLSREKRITAKDLDTVSAYADKRSMAIGEAAVARKLVAPSDIAWAVRSQSIDLIDHAFRQDYSVGSFNPRLQSFQISGRIGFHAVEIELARQAGAPYDAPDDVRLSVVEGADLSSYPWIPEELGVLSALSEPRTIRELIGRLQLAERPLRKILGVLDRLGVMEMAGARLIRVSPELDGREEGEAIVRARDFPFESLIPTVSSSGFDERLEVAREASGFTAEQFKSLKVQLREHESSRKVLTVSSPEPQDGKSFVSLNLALSFAMEPERRVLLVDCDLRSPAVGRYLGVPEEPGLLQYLENSRLSPFCFLRRIEGLYFMSAGGSTPRPIEILSMGKMREMLDRFRGVFDTIILDAPPYSPIADARIVTGHSDGLIFVLRRGKTGYSAADKAFKAIDRKKLVGVVLNDVKPMLFNGYDYGGYHYGKYEYGASGSLTALPEDRKTRSRTYLD